MAQIAENRASGFDPEAWLRTFRDKGGYWLAVADKITMGVWLGGDPANEQAARQMLEGVRQDPFTRQSLRVHILNSAGEV